MASALTYSDFATHVPELATDVAGEQTEVVTYINRAELFVSRATFGETVPDDSNISRADLAVLLLAGHFRNLRLRSKSSHGLDSVGQVAGHSDGLVSVSYTKVMGTSISAQILASTPQGSQFIALAESISATALPFVLDEIPL